MASTTRQRLIGTAKDLFYQQGFRNVGMDQILSEVGLSQNRVLQTFSPAKMI